MKFAKAKVHFELVNEATGEMMRCYRVFDWDTHQAGVLEFINTLGKRFIYLENM